jgi:hypothetical protein
MHDYPIFIFAALLIFGFGLFSRASERSPILVCIAGLSSAAAEKLGAQYWVGFTVLLSVFLHGITAVPLSRLYAKRVAGGVR